MAERAQFFTGGLLKSFIISITTTAATIQSLLAAQMAAEGIEPGRVVQVILWDKVAAGTDRGAVLVGHSAAEMNMFFGIGDHADPPSRGMDWFVKSNSGTITATAYLAMDA